MVNIKKDEWYLSRTLSAVVGDISVPMVLEFTLVNGPCSAQCNVIVGETEALPPAYTYTYGTMFALVDEHAAANQLLQQLVCVLLRGRKFHVLYCTEVPEAVRQMPEPPKGLGPRQWGQRGTTWSPEEQRAWQQGWDVREDEEWQ